jgi:hypothetical protein
MGDGSFGLFGGLLGSSPLCLDESTRESRARADVGWRGLIIANLLVGMSYGWWQREHNRHHANPNKVGADPDIVLPAIALTPAQATKQRSRLMRWLVAHQSWYFFPILLLLGLSMHDEAIRG